MPIFEYSCMNCHHHFEKLQKFGDALPVECPVCGSDQIKKELSVFASTSNASSTTGCSSGG
jgi:putative FmdB family regulatory protein